MKKLFAILALTGLAFSAQAGESCEAKASLATFRCANACPLAKEANSLRAFGNEALAISTVVRAELADAVEANLARI